ncbi:hypothetical protein K435DRAFT_741128 [Dendrothele bispora CBS 962.96]|uniref:Inositol-pentakisphosphate 2-kinase n=1 Tax=Dendrothele bispora (strain CBS 962.96) TaxID=1314807 RepID=A0A4S8MWR1_DENBC|nr:hypothetical protein K435DRAFT_741128 [Dendrothele bispora CBS 962.96]
MAITTEEDITTTSPNDWKYVSEGGATIVFSYVGPLPPTPQSPSGQSSCRVRNQAFEGMVLRLRKVPSVPLGVRFGSDSSSNSSDSSGSSEDIEVEEDDEDEPDDPSIAFQRQCMTRLVPKAHLPRLESISVRSPPGRMYRGGEVLEHGQGGEEGGEGLLGYETRNSQNNSAGGDIVDEHGDHDQRPHHHHHSHRDHSNDGSAWLRALATTHEESRPPARRALGGVDFKRKKGVLATDLVGGQGMSVEIKPKWSFLPNTEHLSAETKPVKTNTCRFCMHSHMRIQGLSAADGAQIQNHESGGISARGYCPLDLFSPDPERVRRAVYTLYDAWIASEGKANNLKMFVRGKGVKVHERKLIFADPPSNIEDDQIRRALADGLLPLLIRTPVLQLLNRLQRSLDMLDIEGLAKVWEKWCRVSSSGTEEGDGTLPPIGTNCEEPTLGEWGSFIDRYLRELGLPEGSGEGPARLERRKVAELPEIDTKEEMRYYLLAYLLSATFKDCSIIVRIPLLGSLDGGSDQRVGEDLEVDPTITMIDLDPKSMKRLRKWELLDREIANIYGMLGEKERKVCVDDWR